MLTNESLLHELYFDRDFNCAESILRYFNTIMDIGICDDDLKLLGGFGGRMGCGRTCGALCGCIALIIKVKIKDHAHEDPGFKVLCGRFMDLFVASLSSVECVQIKEKMFIPEQRCWETGRSSAELLEGFWQTTEESALMGVS